MSLGEPVDLGDIAARFERLDVGDGPAFPVGHAEVGIAGIVAALVLDELRIDPLHDSFTDEPTGAEAAVDRGQDAEHVLVEPLSDARERKLRHGALDFGLLVGFAGHEEGFGIFLAIVRQSLGMVGAFRDISLRVLAAGGHDVVIGHGGSPSRV